MQMEQILSGFSRALFFMVVSALLLALTALSFEVLLLVFLKTARFLLMKIQRDLAAFNEVIEGKAPRKATVARIESGRKMFPKAAAGRASV
jgi:hypothetical protein